MTSTSLLGNARNKLLLLSFSRALCRWKCNSQKLISVSRRCYVHRTLPLLGVKGVEIKMPSLSPTMTEGTIIKWLKKEGDAIQPGDVLCEVQTDKAVVAFEMEEEGILAKILVPEETKDIKIGTLIGLMVMEGQDWKDVEIPAVTSVSAEAVSTAQMPSSPTDKMETTGKPSLFGPAVRTLLDSYGLTPDQISASGPHGSLLKSDVLQYVKTHNIQLQPQEAVHDLTTPTSVATSKPLLEEQSYLDIPVTNMRRTIAKRLTTSKTTIPHAYASIDCRMDGVLKIRKELKKRGIPTSVNDFIIKAAAFALQQVPEVNSTLNGDVVEMQPTIDVSVAVATDTGLITPIVKNANRLSVEQISLTVKELASRAREGKLKLHEFQGGSFSISNLGMFGITEFSAVINPPQAAILAIGTSCPVLLENGKPSVSTTVTLSFDRRAFDDDVACIFLSAFKTNLENPDVLLAGHCSKTRLEMEI